VTEHPKTIDQAALDQFTGTETWYRHSMVPKVTYTEGVKYVAETYGAYWLLDLIVFSQIDSEKLRKEYFQVWKLEVGDDRVGKITVDDGDHNIIHRSEIPFTDFPQPGITLWFVDLVILLPSEY
jgi:hypothetical protein